MRKAKIQKTIYQVVVLSEDPISDDVSLADVAFEIDRGDWIGSTTISGRQEISGRRAIRKELQEIGNDGSFFLLDEL